MRPFKIRTIRSEVKTVKTYVPSDTPSPVGFNTERYIDYTNFQDGYVMVYDEVRNRYHFVNPDDILNDSLTKPPVPEVFFDEITKEFNDIVDIDLGEY